MKVPKFLTLLYNRLATRTLYHKNLDYNFNKKSLALFIIAILLFLYSLILLLLHLNTFEYKIVYDIANPKNLPVNNEFYNFNYSENVFTTEQLAKNYTFITNKSFFKFKTDKNIKKLDIFLGLKNFQQNNKEFTKSLNIKQSDNKDLSKGFFVYNGENFYPNGIVAYTLPQDAPTIKNTKNENIFIDKYNLTNEELNILENSRNKLTEEQFKSENFPITWNKNIKTQKYLPYISWINFSPFPNFYKKYGIVENLEAGDYTLEVYSVFPFGGEKSIIIRESHSGFGQELIGRCIGCFCFSIVCLWMSYFFYRLGC